MSIWNTVGAEPIVAQDLHRDGVNEYAGTGPETAEISVATARSWHDRIRLSVCDAEGYDDGTDVCLSLDAAAARRLADALHNAVYRLAARRSGDS